MFKVNKKGARLTVSDEASCKNSQQVKFVTHFSNVSVVKFE